MILSIDPQGDVRCLYTEALDLDALGQQHIHRASHVEPDAAAMWWVDLSPSNGPVMGPYITRHLALEAEAEWLEAYVL